MVASAIPAAIDGLLTTVNHISGLGNVTVVDGPTAKDIQSDAIAIGLSPDDSDVDANHAVAGLLTAQQAFDVMCLIRSWSGTIDIKARRDRAFALFNSVQTAIAADVTLGNAVTRARISQVMYLPQFDARGCFVDLVFSVHIDAFSSNP